MKQHHISLVLLSINIMSLQAQTVNRYSFDERPEAYQLRQLCGYEQNYNITNYDIEHETNGDQTSVPDFAGNFTKTFAHNATTSVATPQAQVSYLTLVQAINNGDQITYDAIMRDASATIKLVNPQASAAWTLCGRDSALIPIPVPPKLDSREAAAEIIEVYLQAICRNVSFNDYGTGVATDADLFNGGSITNNAAAVLTAYGADYKGPKVGGIVTASVLFRGNPVGCLVGPYISQFMWQDLHRLQQVLLPVKQYIPIASNREFGVTWTHFLAIQNGSVPVPYNSSDFVGTRYTINGRDAGTWVHNDLPLDSYLTAYNILLNNGFPPAPNFPYNNGSMPNEDPFVTMGVTDVSAVLCDATNYALKQAWAHKWRAARRLRPEAMGGLMHYTKSTGNNPYGLNSDIFATLAGINVLDWTKWRNMQQAPTNPANNTYLLALMYPEGSPAHPAYPAGHATVAGAAVTIIKAFVDDQALFKDYLTPVKPNPVNPNILIPLSGEGEDVMTVGGELDKLAFNIALARDFAGVHYRSDGAEGIALGEQAAIYYLQDWGRQYAEQLFTGFELTKMNGTRIRITGTAIIPL